MMSGLFFCLSILVYKCIMDKNVYDNIWFYKTRGKYRSLSTSFIMASNLNKEGNLNQVTLGYLSYENIRDHFLTSVFLDHYKAVSHQTFF